MNVNCDSDNHLDQRFGCRGIVGLHFKFMKWLGPLNFILYSNLPPLYAELNAVTTTC